MRIKDKLEKIDWSVVTLKSLTAFVVLSSFGAMAYDYHTKTEQRRFEESNQKAAVECIGSNYLEKTKNYRDLLLDNSVHYSIEECR